jgi:hypothetical protein
MHATCKKKFLSSLAVKYIFYYQEPSGNMIRIYTFILKQMAYFPGSEEVPVLLYSALVFRYALRSKQHITIV